MKKIIIFYLVVYISLLSCGYIPPKWIRKENGGKQAVSSAYHLSKKPFVYSDLIDTASIYVFEDEYYTTDRRGEILHGLTTRYNYMRFSSQGILFSQILMLDFPDSMEVNAMESGQYCYYSVKGDILKVEHYNFDRRNFEYWYGRIQEDGDIFFFKEKGRPWGRYKGYLKYHYHKLPAKLTRRIVFPLGG